MQQRAVEQRNWILNSTISGIKRAANEQSGGADIHNLFGFLFYSPLWVNIAMTEDLRLIQISPFFGWENSADENGKIKRKKSFDREELWKKWVECDTNINRRRTTRPDAMRVIIIDPYFAVLPRFLSSSVGCRLSSNAHWLSIHRLLVFNVHKKKFLSLHLPFVLLFAFSLLLIELMKFLILFNVFCSFSLLLFHPLSASQSTFIRWHCASFVLFISALL